MNIFPVISRHAIDRYRERVDPSSSPREAAEVISRVLDTGTARPRPRHWMRVASTAPGTRYLYSANWPDVGLVVADGVVVTLHSRGVCRMWVAGRRLAVEHNRRPTPYRRARHLAGESA